ncbi:MAG: Ig domain-containing protein [Gemmatimonadaceae bacterium]|nr:Ig domain-containing protein [Gemmatimonadaceae bacterium]
MQLFSRKKALVALSLGALTALGACGDDVTVTPAPVAPVVISITPPSATMNIGEALNLAVQITGGTNVTLSSCTSSNTAVATAAVQGSACRVTAVSSGNVTITAASSTNNVAAAAITVAPAAAAISNLTTSPTTAGLSVGQTLTIVPNVTKAASTVAVTYAYASSNAAIASVNATSGVVTAVAPGTATITVTANGSGTGFTSSALTAGVTVNGTAAPPALTGLTVSPTSIAMAVGSTRQIGATVTAAPGITAPTPTYTSNATSVATVSSTGLVTAVAPGSAQVTVTATSAGNATLAATTLTQLVDITVSPRANVTIQSIIQGPYLTSGIDSSYVGWGGIAPLAGSGPTGPNQGVIAGIRVSANPQLDQSVDVTNTKDQIQVVLNLQTNGQKVDSVVVYVDPANDGRRAAARQTFSQAPSGDTEIRLYILTDDFTPNAGTGVGDVHFSNGLKQISASVWSGTTEIQNASAARQNINFNNIDGFALTMTKPANTALDASNRSWWGGPTVSDIGQQTGVTSFQAWPVIYTPGRSIIQLTAGFGRCLGHGGNGIPNGVTKTALPFTFTAGTAAPAGSTAQHIACGGVVGAYDLSDNWRFEDYPYVIASLDNSQNPGPRTIYAYNPSLGTDPFAGPRPSLYRNSPQVQAPTALRVDYQAPSLTLAVTQSNGERWVNDAYAFGTNYTATDGTPAVGLFPTASRNTSYSVAGANANACNVGTTLTTVGGPSATIAQIPASVVAPNREHPCDFTNNAFAAQATETDRLGNRGTIGGLTSPLFGIDNTAPEVMTAWDGTAGPIPDMPNHYLATSDSIFQPAGVVAATPTATTGGATDFWFGVRYRDSRSGFNINNHGSRTVKRYAPNATPLNSNVGVVTTVDSRTMNFIGGSGNPVETEDPTYRRDSITVYGRGGLSGTSGTQNPAVASSAVLVGYYQYDLSLVDRALNTSTYRQRSVVDRTSPEVTLTQGPAVFGASGTATAVAQSFIPTGTDDLEAFDSDLFMRYAAFDMVGDGSIGSLTSTLPANRANRVKFRRERGGQPGFANWHNVWQVFSDTLLSTPFGPGAALSSNGMLMPIPSLRGVEPVDSTDAPVAWGLATNPFAQFKPDQIGVYAFDVRATHRGPSANPALFPAPYAADLPFNNLGHTNRTPGTEAAYTESIFPGNVSNGSRWDVKDLNPSTAANDLMLTWAGFAISTSSVQVRVTTSTVVTQPPFPVVHLFRWEADVHHTGTGTNAAATTLADTVPGNWVYITSINSTGAPANPSLFDQGSTRFWTYTMTFAAHNIGAVTQSGTTTGCYRAVGADISGDGVVTKSFGTGCPTVAPVAAGTNATVTLRAHGNGAGTIARIVGLPATTFTLNKAAGQFVSRISENRDQTSAHTIRITPASGHTLQTPPTGCSSITLVGATAYPALGNGAGTVYADCVINVGFGPRTVGATFDFTP